MKEYLKMAVAFPHAKVGKSPVKPWVSGEYFVFYENQAEYAAHAINSHDELVAEVELLRGSLLQCVEALHVAHKFCGNHTAEECGDEIAIPISDALVAASKLVAP